MKYFAQKVIAASLICSLVLVSAPRKAQAIPVEDLVQIGYGAIQEVIDALNLESTLAIEIKEYILDTALYVIKEEFISSITDDIRDWAATGFQGSPHFLEDPEGFFTGVATEATGVFLSDVGGILTGDPNFFCNLKVPKFVLDIGIVGNKPYKNRAKCTINQALNNVQGFYDDFQNGSWDTFFQIQQRQNNQFGEYSLGLREINSRTQIADERFRMPAVSGGGFLPSVECESKTPIINADGSAGELCSKWVVKTPSKSISERVTSYIQNDINRAIPGDEISEIIAGLVVAAVQGSLQNLADN